MLLLRGGYPKPPKSPRISFDLAWTRPFIVFGAFFDVVSTLLPWGVSGLSMYQYLSWSIFIGNGVLLPASEFSTISVLIRAAAIVGWAGVVLYEYVERRVLPYGVVLASGFLSFLAVVLFATTGVNFSWGAYLALVGGVFMVLGVVMEKLEVEIVVEREEAEKENKG